MRAVLIGLLISISTAYAQSPHIQYRGVVNAASFMAPGLPAGAIARGSTISVFGSNLGPGSSPALAFPLQNVLGGVSIALKQGGTVVAAIPLFVSAGQINAIVPSNTPLGVVSLQLTFNSAVSNSVPVTITNSTFGIFAVAGGVGPGILQNYVSGSVQPVNSLSGPATPKQFMTLWGTGLGPGLNADNLAPQAGNLPVQTEVLVGGVSAKVDYNGRSPCCAGIDQVVFEVPPDAPLGCWVPVFVRTAGTTVSNSVTMAISADGKPCSEPSNAMAAPLLAGGRTARFLAARVAIHHDLGVSSANDSIADVSSAYVAQETSGAYNFDPTVSLPPAGTCTAYTYARDFSTNSGLPPGLPNSTPTGRALDAGNTGIAPQSTNFAFEHEPTTGITYFGAAIPTLNTDPNFLFFNPGGFYALASGGNDVPAFAVKFNTVTPPAWNGRDQLQTITRNQGFVASWSGAADGTSVFIAGGGADLPANASAAFVCTARPGDTSLTVPPYILANVPAAHTNLIQSRGVIYLGEWPLASPIPISTPGLDSGVVMPMQILGKTVVFQ